MILERTRDAGAPVSVVLLTATQWLGPAPCYVWTLPVVAESCRCFVWVSYWNTTCLFHQKQRQREWPTEIDGETDWEEAEVCLHLCDKLSRSVSSPSLGDLAGSHRGRTQGVKFPAIYHQPWPGRLWDFRDSFNAVVEPESGADLTHGYKKLNKGYALTVAPRGQSNHARVNRNRWIFVIIIPGRTFLQASLGGGVGVMVIGGSVVQLYQKIAQLFWF